MNFFFGERWDAPVVDDAAPTATPVGALCYACGEPIEDGDRGFVRVVVRWDRDGVALPVEPVHAECDLRSLVGHDLGICPCGGYDASRASARLVWQRVGEQRGRPVEEFPPA